MLTITGAKSGWRKAAQAASHFFNWWVGELSELLPKNLRASRDNAVLTVETEKTGLLTFGKTIGGQWSFLGWEGKTDQGGPAKSLEIRPFLESSAGVSTPILLRITAPNVMRKRISLPLAAAENLREVLSFQMEKHTPFRAEEVYYGLRILRRDEAAKWIEVDFAVVPRPLVAEKLAQLRDSGIEPAGLIAGGANGVPDLPIDMSAVAAPRTGGSARRTTRLLAGVAFLLLAANITVPVARDHAAMAELTQELIRARAEARLVTSLRREIETSQHQLTFAGRRAERMPTMMEILAELTRRIPDDSWITQAMIEGDLIHLVGYSASANGLIAVLEQSPLFTSATFRSPVTQDAVRGVEQFQLSISLRRRLE
jgi:general secretion pathway protein L